MMTREDIRDLASFQADAEACAVSFYFQPSTPQDRSHKAESILAKDLVKRALSEASKQGKNGCARADLDRILALAENLRGNQARAKAVFASSKVGFWREYDLPARLPSTQIVVNRRFYLKPLASLLGAYPKLGVVLVDRQRGRFFNLRLDELKEGEQMFQKMPRRRSDGFGGYDGGHAERRVSNEYMQHYKNVAQRLKDDLERGQYEKIVVGCHDANWSEFEAQLHPYAKQRVLGHFPADVAAMTPDEIRTNGDRVLHEWQDSRCRTLVRDTLGLARGNSRGVTGLRRVLRALQMGEVQTLMLGENYTARAVECTGCGFLDSHVVSFCAVCGRATRELENVCEAMIPIAIQRDIELFYVKSDSEFDHVGNIAAMLRFRADQSRAPQVAVA